MDAGGTGGDPHMGDGSRAALSGHLPRPSTAGGGAGGGKVAPEVGLCEVRRTAAGVADALFEAPTTFQWYRAEVARPPEGAVVLAKNAALATGMAGA